MSIPNKYYLIKTGELDADQFKRIGFAAVSGAGEGFIREKSQKH